ncbi:MAG: helix-turn-helix domain-containing protein, partial [Nitrospinota bacterium]|nr:helix-turn-helix domain-containing protein [Nitrospinota bacterium]
MPNIKYNEILQRILVLQAEQSLADFCQSIGLNYENMRKCFQRNSLPDTESLAKIAQHFHLDLQWLVSGIEPSSRLNQIIAKRIMVCRILKGWSQSKLGSQLSLPARMLEWYEQGKCLFSSDLIDKFSDALGVHPGVLLSDESTPLFQSPQLKIFQTTSAQKDPQISGE